MNVSVSATSSAVTTERRTSRKAGGWRVLLRENWYRDLWLFVVTGLTLWAILATKAHVDDIQREGVARRDQTCRLFERDEKAAIDQLVGTYQYLRGLSVAELKSPLNQAVAAQLDQVESNARASNAPPYCDAPGVGLPESLEQPIPSRPPGL